MNCPQCGGQMWDNRTGKKNPRAPDFKCKNPKCQKAIWLDSSAPVQKPATGSIPEQVKNGDDERIRSMCLAYSKDLVVAGKVQIEQIADMAEQFVEWVKGGTK